MTDSEPLLELRRLSVRYGRALVVNDLDLSVNPGEIVGLLGANGAGKSTVLRAISGLVAANGTIEFDGQDIGPLPAHARPGLGIAHVPEGRQVFADQSVEDNLRLGAYYRHQRRARAGVAKIPILARWQGGKREVAADIERLLQRFPVLAERRRSLAGGLSGGEQQQLAIARALMARPRLLLLDEPSLGLAPALVDQVFELVRELRAESVTILLVEQLAYRALELADRAYVLQSGRLVISGAATQVAAHPQLEAAYLGTATR